MGAHGWRLSGDVPLRVGQTCPLTAHVLNQLGLFVAGAIMRWVRGHEYGLVEIPEAVARWSREETFAVETVAVKSHPRARLQH